jgi:geranylgeranyl diphosphate synthase type I
VSLAVPGVLDRARELVNPALRDAVARLSPELAPLVRYHFGWADPDGRPVAGGQGKAIRPALAMLSAEAAGAPAAAGVPGAVAVELVHNYSLIHDDVIDGDHERHHRQTVWSRFGIGQAIIVGDALVTLAFEVLLDTAGPHAREAATALVRATDSIIAGQAADMAFERRSAVTVQECAAMERAKTGALLACAAAIGAVVAGAPPPLVRALEEFGTNLGLAFQAVDDVLGIWGRSELTGKPVASDLRQQKKTMPIVYALEAGNGIATELRRLLAAHTLSEQDLARATALIEEGGGRRRTEQAAADHFDRALGSLAAVSLATPVRDELVALARFVVDRTF